MKSQQSKLITQLSANDALEIEDHDKCYIGVAAQIRRFQNSLIHILKVFFSIFQAHFITVTVTTVTSLYCRVN